MAYIGHSASGNFTTKPSKDTFSGDGSTTAFTLSEGATTNTVDVFVENVRQEPTTAYTVDGTTLTFTAAPGSGTNNIYVVNRGPLQLSATHPAAQALEASTGTFTGNLGVGTASPAQKLHLQSGGTTYMRSENTGISAVTDFGTDGTGSTIINRSAVPMRFFTNGTERLRILSGGGLTFNGDTAATDALDDYEEGTWTPTAGSNVSAISSAGGFYTKVGNLVTVSFIATLTPTGTGSAMVLGGLPYAVADKLSGTQAEATGVVFEDASLFLSLALGASSNLHIEFDRPIQGSTPSIQEIYRGSLAYFTT